MGAIITDWLDMGLINLFFSFAAPFLYAFLPYRFMWKLIPSRFNFYTLAALALVYALWANLRQPDLFGTNYHFWMNLFINALTLFTITFLYSGKFWQKLLIWWFFELMKAMCQAIAYIPAILYFGYIGTHPEWSLFVSSVAASPALQSITLLSFLAVFLLLGSLSVKILRGGDMRRFSAFYIVIVTLTMGHVYSLSRVIHPSMGDLVFGILIRFVPDATTAYDILALSGIAAGFAASAALFYYIVSLDMKAAIDAQLQEVKRTMELEQSHYHDITRRNEELAKIRHDFSNHVASVIRLARNGERKAAQELIDALRDEIIRDAER